jgi:hypothetical protein
VAECFLRHRYILLLYFYRETTTYFFCP